MSHNHPMENSNPSANKHIDALIEQRLSRRDVLKGGATVGAGLMMGSVALTGCGETKAAEPLTLKFSPVAKSIADSVTVPNGYTAHTLVSWGDPLFSGGTVPSTITALTSAQQEQAIGDHHDGMYYFGLSAAGLPDRNSNDRGLLVINHEAVTEDFVHANGPTFDKATLDANSQLLPKAGDYSKDSLRSDAEECLKEMALHGISVVEVVKQNGRYRYVQGSPFNRRLTPYSPMQISGPARGSDLLKTAYDPSGLMARGTLNNCANGFTPWGTYLTCEENWAGYFGHADVKLDTNDNTVGRVALAAGTPEQKRQARYGIARHGFQQLRWYSAPDPVGSGDRAQLMSRFQLQPQAGMTASQDYRNEANTFGYVVEIDPYDPLSTPKKRTALGRFSHEGCWPKFVVGKKMAFYMGDDSRGEYLYKFVTDAVFTGNENRTNDILDNGTLYAAKFNANGMGEWLPLAASNATLAMTAAEIAVFTREAADKLGATKMDRPEWTAVNPNNGEVYLTLTNNSQRTTATADAANPRAYSDAFGSPTTRTSKGNVNGHIIRLAETSDDPAATTFRWDIYVFGAESDAAASVNLSGLTDANDFSSPDGLWFDPRGILWIQTDDGAYLDETNCMMLAAIPGKVGDGAPVTVNNAIDATTSTVVSVAGKAPTTDNLKRFLVGPKGAEITGIDMTPDRKALFVNIQHPGESGGFSNYSQASSFTEQSSFNALELTPGSRRARSATLVITKDDGGEIAV
ncbi:PhoX family protein [Perlucidibaca aquatica]|uniref:PhoX family protein n=1 Tax=Perlucidibaca aquatica TaxID=1852776 RepID=UPI000839DC29|nr:PhoX family phosphatase [Perlucidibaca aquatica]